MYRSFIFICVASFFSAFCSAESAPVLSTTVNKGDSVITTFFYNQIGETTLVPDDGVLVVEDGTFRVTMSPGESGYTPRYLKACAARIKEGGIIVVESLDGKEISDIQFDMLFGSNVPDSKILFSAYVNGEMCRIWKGWDTCVEFTTARDPMTEELCPTSEDGKYFYFIPRIHIKRYTGLKMNLALDGLTTSRAEPAVAQYSLRVWNDDGIKDFTVTATDAENGTTYGSCTIWREQGEAMMTRSANASNENDYTLSGRMELPGITSSTRTKLHLNVSANYGDGRESVTLDTPTEVNVKPTISTGVTDMTSEDAPCEYFNMQGIRVARPATGIYIRRQGTHSSVVFIP